MGRETFSDLTLADIAEMDRQRAAIRELAKTALGYGGEIDLPTLQLLVDADVVAVEDTWRLQGFGVCFGDAITHIAPISWRIIEDEWGRDPTLCWENSKVNLNALTVLSKRIEDGERPEVERLARELVNRGLELTDEHWR
ncbi:DUF3806 domain-containing protein [Brevundimonas sp. SL161]|uniref:DUF3806 domain-containing protein n=1 Tax=Brevundimonas sp. SL161 TaxID=2804613 RepID=UPI003CF541FA